MIKCFILHHLFVLVFLSICACHPAAFCGRDNNLNVVKSEIFNDVYHSLYMDGDMGLDQYIANISKRSILNKIDRQMKKAFLFIVSMLTQSNETISAYR